MMAKQHFWFVYFNFGSDFGLGLIHCHSKLSLFRSRFERRKKEREREKTIKATSVVWCVV